MFQAISARSGTTLFNNARRAATSSSWPIQRRVVFDLTQTYCGTYQQTTVFSGAALAPKTAPLGGIWAPDVGSIHPRQIGGDSAP
ncbi:MAG: hypothetical protein NTW96_27075 [Planctomycetia bacterium]|nr:hypothetical protein [Planctomycetia bacterium]